ncbi:hypothetical protein EZJ55_20655 [Microcystis aeruginosa EAWAG127a]|uniref:Uncharacterized protein n=1 Tax=Microcystis aeruginosa EAWAG127a TaxID=2529855 RepID=A0A5J5LYT2_MICAE|nr:hypothetical protein EZJ55_20655 [Microcystis aeruginosa EAWAG127a]
MGKNSVKKIKGRFFSIKFHNIRDYSVNLSSTLHRDESRGSFLEEHEWQSLRATIHTKCVEYRLHIRKDKRLRRRNFGVRFCRTLRLRQKLSVRLSVRVSEPVELLSSPNVRSLTPRSEPPNRRTVENLIITSYLLITDYCSLIKAHPKIPSKRLKI